MQFNSTEIHRFHEKVGLTDLHSFLADGLGEKHLGKKLLEKIPLLSTGGTIFQGTAVTTKLLQRMSDYLKAHDSNLTKNAET